MAIPSTLTTDPHEIIAPSDRWRPGKDELANISIANLLPPLVDKVRHAVHQWREQGYPDISETSRALLAWWFDRDAESTEKMRYYFCQREAVETIIYLYELAMARSSKDLMAFSSGEIEEAMLPEAWARYVIKMATGSGKTKVISLAILWSYFHKCYEADSPLARNILLIAPNIIVMDRLRRDFEGLKIFHEDGALPDNGYAGRNWKGDFQMRLHIQDEVRVVQPTGNLFLANIHRVYDPATRQPEPSPDDEDLTDYFLGRRPTGKTTDSQIDLGAVVRQDIDELLIINDEAHHIHDPKMAWSRSIEDIHNHLVQKGQTLSLQLDVTATPKHNNGAIFAHTVCDYPLVEAIHQGIVKRPVVPDDESVGKLEEHLSPKFSEQYADYIRLGVEEWRKVRDVHQEAGRKAVLFLMADDTRNCDELGEYLEQTYRDLEGRVLVIHTKKNGEINESATSQNQQELQRLRQEAANIDLPSSPYSAVVSVLVLREGWDVRNVTTIVGLRAYSAQSNILPEQTLGRGLRLMYPGESNTGEKVSVIGSPAFVDFVKRIEQEGVELEQAPMGSDSTPQGPLIISIRKDDPKLDLSIPRLGHRFRNEYAAVFNLKAEDIPIQPITYEHYDPKTANRTIVFRDILTGDIDHETELSDSSDQDYRTAIAFFVRQIWKPFGLFSNYPFFYDLTQDFIRDYLFGQTIDLSAADTLRNLNEPHVMSQLIESVQTAIKNAIRQETNASQIDDSLRVSDMRPFPMQRQATYQPRKSLQNHIATGGNKLELDFAEFLDSCPDVTTFAYNYMAVGFSIEYTRADGTISRYFPDFLVRDKDDTYWIIETKGRMDDNDKRKMEQLDLWCKDVNQRSADSKVDHLLVMEKGFRQYRQKTRTFDALVKLCRVPKPPEA